MSYSSTAAFLRGVALNTKARVTRSFHGPDVAEEGSAQQPSDKDYRDSHSSTSISSSDVPPSRVRQSPSLRRVSSYKSYSIIYEPYVQASQRTESALAPVEGPAWRKMRCDVRIFTTPTADTPGTCLMLHFDDKRYLIGNIHEGTQRACIERNIKLTRISDIFLTGKTEWKNTGGLIGMIFTLADTTTNAAKGGPLNDRTIENKQRDESSDKQFTSGENGDDQVKADRPTLNIHGGPNLMHTLAAGRRFIFRKGMPVNVDEMDGKGAMDLSKPTWMDKNVKVWAMSISPSRSTGGSSPRATSPRKRSFNEFEDGESSVLESLEDRLEEHQESPAERRDREQQIRKAVVSEMFDSDWRLDALLETWLEEVKMPAVIFVRDPETRKIVKYTGPVPGESKELPHIKVLVRKPWPGALIEHLPPTTPSQTAMSYFVRYHPQRGKFKPVAAKNLNVEMGPAWAKLASGESVLSKDGKLVTPDMVLGEGKDGGGIAVVELPSRDYVQNLIERPEWKAPEVMTGIGAVIWILGAGVGQDESLQKFMSDSSHLKHIVSSQDYCPNYLSMHSSASAAIRLHQLDPMRYPIPLHDNVTLPQPGQPALPEGQTGNTIKAQPGQMIVLEPFFGIQTSNVVPPLNTAMVLYETPAPVLALAQTAKDELSSDVVREQMAKQDLPSQDAEIITLGTGSALPSKYRNVSATLLRVPGYGSYLLDCGENTLGQLKRVFPPEELAEVLRDLKLIWISHLHADHHLGTTSVIKAWYQEVYGEQIANGTISKKSLTDELLYPSKTLEQEKRLFVASEDSMLQWLREYSSVEDFGFDKIVPLCVQGAKPGFPENTIMRWNGRVVGFKTYEPNMYLQTPSSHLCPFFQLHQNHILTPLLPSNRALRTSTGLSSLAAVFVKHCRGAMAVTLTFPTGFKFSYSGDCRPSASFAEIGKDSTVLVHEATFDDELQGDAEAKKHSTTSEALGVAVAMRARRVLLTHFSQRYAKIPVMGDVGGLGKGVEEEWGEELGESMEGVEGQGMGDQESGEGQVDSGVPSNSTPESRPRDRSTNHTRAPSPHAILVSPAATAGSAAVTDMKVGVAFDYMRVRVGDIAALERFTPALLKLYEEEEEGDDKAGAVGEGETAEAGKAAGKGKKGKKEKGKNGGEGKEAKKKKPVWKLEGKKPKERENGEEVERDKQMQNIG